MEGVVGDQPECFLAKSKEVDVVRCIALHENVALMCIMHASRHRLKRMLMDAACVFSSYRVVVHIVCNNIMMAVDDVTILLIVD